MDNKKLKLFAAALAVLLAVNTFLLFDLRERNRALRDDLTNLAITTSNSIARLERELYNLSVDMDEGLSAASSFLSDSSFSARRGDDGIRAELRFTPKEMRAGETAAVIFTSGGESVRVAAAPGDDGSFLAEAVLPLSPIVDAAVVLESDGAVRREAVDELDMRAALSFRYEARFVSDSVQGDENDGGVILMLQPRDNETALPFGGDASMYVSLTESDSGAEAGRMELEPLTVTADELLQYDLKAPEGSLILSFDASQYLTLEGSYAFVCVIDAGGGLKYSFDAARFDNYPAGNGSTSRASGHSGSGGLAEPVFE